MIKLFFVNLLQHLLFHKLVFTDAFVLILYLQENTAPLSRTPVMTIMRPESHLLHFGARIFVLTPMFEYSTLEKYFLILNRNDTGRRVILFCGILF